MSETRRERLAGEGSRSEDTVLSVTFDVREAGDEIVIHLSGDSVYRTSLASPGYGQRFDDTIPDELIAPA